MNLKHLPHMALVVVSLFATTYVASQVPAQRKAVATAERSIGDWLTRMHEASMNSAYVGTFVVSSSSGSLSSSRIWHVCDPALQVERVESLTGAPRTTFRHNEQVVTFLPDKRVIRSETHDSMGLFPSLSNDPDPTVAKFYTARRTGSERVAGFLADIVEFTPKDKLRFGYRIWSEKKTGLVIKLQTLDTEGGVLEQAAFSELTFEEPLSAQKLASMMTSTAGFTVEKQTLVKTTPEIEGWNLKTPVAGFHTTDCFRRPPPLSTSGAPGENMVQWIFTDGLASVSLFVEKYDASRHSQEGLMAMGATQTLTRRMGGWWLTAVGEVPPQTLLAFAQSIERKK